MASASDANPLGTDFPGRWMRTKIGRVTTKVGSGATPKGGAVVYQDHGVPLIRSLNVHNDGFRSDDLAFISDNHARQLDYASVEPGDVLLNITGASILRSAIAPPEIGVARVNQHVSILRPNTRVILPEFLHAWLISPIMHSFMYSQNVGSTREAITKEQILRFPVILPSLAEQQSISRYLGTKTAEIDGLIGKLARQVELLEQYRRELIAHTVTRGLDPDVPMKDSGIEWIGDLPEHWNVHQIKHLVAVRNVPAEPHLPYLGLEDLVSFRGLNPEWDVEKAMSAERAGNLALPGDVVFSKLRVYLAKTMLIDFPVRCTSELIVLEPKDVDKRFLSYITKNQSFIGYLNTNSYGTRMPRMSPYTLVHSRIPVPPLEEQQHIADYLDQKTSDIDATIAAINKQIELLGRYRKQVINDLVTGKVRAEEVA